MSASRSLTLQSVLSDRPCAYRSPTLTVDQRSEERRLEHHAEMDATEIGAAARSTLDDNGMKSVLSGGPNDWRRVSTRCCVTLRVLDDPAVSLAAEEMRKTYDHMFSKQIEVEREADLTAQMLAANESMVATAEREEQHREVVCGRCALADSFEGNELLLCMGQGDDEEGEGVCPNAFHLNCLRPRLMCVPHGTWLCPTCNKKAAAAKFAVALIADKVENDDRQKSAEGENEESELQTHAEGLELHLASKSKKRHGPWNYDSKTGYTGVRKQGYLSYKAYTYEKGKQVGIGVYRTALDAAVGYAKYMLAKKAKGEGQS